MIHNDIQNQLALLVKTSAPQLVEIAQTPVETPEWVPGQRLPAHVIASLPNGRFQVLVEDQTLDMNLPANTQAGEKLELVYLSSSPRPTFALVQDLAKSLPQNSGVRLSEAAKFLGGLLERGNSATTAAGAATQAAPILKAPPADIAQFAASLRSSVAQSGLFYESHQAQWVTGDRSLASLMREPQASLLVKDPQMALIMKGTIAAQMLQGQPSVQSQTDANVPPAIKDTLAPLPVDGPDKVLRQTSQSDQAAGTMKNLTPTANAIRELVMSHAAAYRASEHTGSVAREPVHPLAQPIVHQQLEALDTRQIQWQGQVWPGQMMEWEIQEDTPQQTQENEDNAPRWSTRLHLELPSLGGVTAHLALDQLGVKVEFAAEDGSTATLMRSKIASLASSMEASGLKVAGLMVQNPEAG